MFRKILSRLTPIVFYIVSKMLRIKVYFLRKIIILCLFPCPFRYNERICSADDQSNYENRRCNVHRNEIVSLNRQ